MIAIQRRRQRCIIINVWNILQGICPNDLKLEFYFNIRTGIKCKVPKLTLQYSKHQTLYDNSFAVKGPRLWNVLPNYLTAITKINSSLKHYLINHQYLDIQLQTQIQYQITTWKVFSPELESLKTCESVITSKLNRSKYLETL